MDGVEGWLSLLGLGQYVEAFHREEVDMQSLPLLTEDDLIALGLTNPIHRHILLANTGKVPLQVLNDATNLELMHREHQRKARKAAKRARRAELDLALALSASLADVGQGTGLPDPSYSSLPFAAAEVQQPQGQWLGSLPPVAAEVQQPQGQAHCSLPPVAAEVDQPLGRPQYGLPSVPAEGHELLGKPDYGLPSAAAEVAQPLRPPHCGLPSVPADISHLHGLQDAEHFMAASSVVEPWFAPVDARNTLTGLLEQPNGSPNVKSRPNVQNAPNLPTAEPVCLHLVLQAPVSASPVLRDSGTAGLGDCGGLRMLTPGYEGGRELQQVPQSCTASQQIPPSSRGDAAASQWRTCVDTSCGRMCVDVPRGHMCTDASCRSMSGNLSQGSMCSGDAHGSKWHDVSHGATRRDLLHGGMQAIPHGNVSSHTSHKSMRSVPHSIITEHISIESGRAIVLGTVSENMSRASVPAIAGGSAGTQMSQGTGGLGPSQEVSNIGRAKSGAQQRPGHFAEPSCLLDVTSQESEDAGHLVAEHHMGASQGSQSAMALGTGGVTHDLAERALGTRHGANVSVAVGAATGTPAGPALGSSHGTHVTPALNSGDAPNAGPEASAGSVQGSGANLAADAPPKLVGCRSTESLLLNILYPVVQQGSPPSLWGRVFWPSRVAAEALSAWEGATPRASVLELMGTGGRVPGEEGTPPLVCRRSRLFSDHAAPPTTEVTTGSQGTEALPPAIRGQEPEVPTSEKQVRLAALRAELAAAEQLVEELRQMVREAEDDLD
eukprot:jgi/Botrbrau1/14226/Bobra.0099s0001.1